MNQWKSKNAASTNPTAVPTGATNVKVFVEPASTNTVIIDAINGATSSIWVEMYELTDTNVANALVSAASKGRDVRVMLEPKAWKSSTVPTYDSITQLLQSGKPHLQFQQNLAHVSGFKHQKFMIIDGTVAYIMTANFSVAALGGSKTQVNREYIIHDTDPLDIQALQSIFLTDWQGGSPLSLTAKAPNLVVSSINSNNMLVALIGSAKSNVHVESEEFNDPGIAQALINKAGLGVEVKMILPPQQPPPPPPQVDRSAIAIANIKQHSITLKTNALYYMHAKLIIVDQKIAFVGSQNLSTESLSFNREVGIIISNQDVVNTLHTTFIQDWGSVASGKGS